MVPISEYIACGFQWDQTLVESFRLTQSNMCTCLFMVKLAENVKKFKRNQ